VAIKKSYFSTYGWEVDDAYYKINGWQLLDAETNLYNFSVAVYRNKKARTDELDPIIVNSMKLVVDEDSFDDDLSESDNFKTVGYTHLRSLTKSFIQDAKDV